MWVDHEWEIDLSLNYSETSFYVSLSCTVLRCIQPFQLRLKEAYLENLYHDMWPYAARTVVLLLSTWVKGMWRGDFDGKLKRIPAKKNFICGSKFHDTGWAIATCFNLCEPFDGMCYPCTMFVHPMWALLCSCSKTPIPSTPA